jgi:hypothetical protein
MFTGGKGRTAQRESSTTTAKGDGMYVPTEIDMRRGWHCWHSYVIERPMDGLGMALESGPTTRWRYRAALRAARRRAKRMVARLETVREPV